MTEKIVLRPKTPDTQPQRHFEDVWEASERLFDSNKLNVDSILNELQAKVSLYRMLGTGSFDAEELARTKAALIGKILITLTKLSLKENVNTFTALSGAIEEQKLMNLESTNQGSNFDKFFAEISSKASVQGSDPNVSKDLLNGLKDALTKLTNASID